MKFIQDKLTFDMIPFFSFLKRPFRTKVIPAQIWKDLDELKNSPTKLKRYFAKFKTTIHFIKPKNEDEPFVYVTGVTHQDPVHADIYIHSKMFNKRKFTTYWWRRFKVRLIQTLLHELIHMMQYINGHEIVIARYKKTGITMIDDEREYFSSNDEIAAYANDIFIDYKMFRPNVPINKLLKRFRTKKDSATFNLVLSAFDSPKGNNAFKQYIKGIKKWERKYSKILVDSY